MFGIGDRKFPDGSADSRVRVGSFNVANQGGGAGLEAGDAPGERFTILDPKGWLDLCARYGLLFERVKIEFQSLICIADTSSRFKAYAIYVTVQGDKT